MTMRAVSAFTALTLAVVATPVAAQPRAPQPADLFANSDGTVGYQTFVTVEGDGASFISPRSPRLDLIGVIGRMFHRA